MYGRGDRFGLVALSLMTALLPVLIVKRWHSYEWATKGLALTFLAGVIVIPWRGLRALVPMRKLRNVSPYANSRPLR